MQVEAAAAAAEEEVLEEPKVANMMTETDYLRHLWCLLVKDGRMDLASGEGKNVSAIDDHEVNRFETMLTVGRSRARCH